MALKLIHLRDFVIVAELELDLQSGFTVLTGETGAGKSILIDALQLVTGSRADVGVVREGAQRAEVSAEFDLPQSLTASLEEIGFDAETNSLLLRRTVDLQGKSRAWINGSPATAQQLRTIGEHLLDIYGQHAWQSLTRADSVRDLLDAYAGIDSANIHQRWGNWRTTLSALEHAEAARENLQKEQERLQWQIAEIEKLNPGTDEWDELNSSHSRLANAQALLDAAQAGVQTLEDSEQSALDLLNSARQKLLDLAHIEADFQEQAEVLSSSIAQVEDVVHTLNSYLRHVDLDPQRLSELDERISLWISLARRFKHTPADLPRFFVECKQDLEKLQMASDLQVLKAAEKAARIEFLAEANAISQKRKDAAPKLSLAITETMQGLGMKGGLFKVELQMLDEPSQYGLEQIEFQVAAHPGTMPRAIGKVASGGELSRIALAISVTTSQLGSAQTLIFDEVDSGIGGSVAQTVGKLMHKLGKDRQVLAVTHLPQVAACADHHLVVTKRSENGATISSVNTAQNSDRVNEIARMLGGEKLTEATMAHAREMLKT